MGILIMMAMPLVEGCMEAKNDHFTWSVAFFLPTNADGWPHLGLAGPVVGVHQDVLLIGGGANFPGGMPWQGNKKEYDRTLYAYRQNNSGHPELLGKFQFPDSVAYGANANTPQGVVVAGGEDENGLLSQVLLIAWDTETHTPTFRDLPDLPEATANASLALLGHTLYMAGGEKKDTVSDELLALDLSNPEAGWLPQAVLPYPVSHACLVAQQDGLYLMGGRKRNHGSASDFYDGVWLLDVVSGEWKARAALPKALSAATAVAVGDNELLFIGGDDGGTFVQVEGAIAAISREDDDTQKKILDQQKVTLLENHPGFDKAVWSYNIEEDSWLLHSEIQLTAPVTTTATWWKGSLYVPSGEIRAGVRSPEVLIGKWSDTTTRQTK